MFFYNRSNKILWGIFLIFVGILILLSNYDLLWFSFKFSRDWPLILVAWGILKIIDYLRQREWFRYKPEPTKDNPRKIIEDLKNGKITAEEAVEKLK